MRNIALRLSYDGSRYHGWQIQKNDISLAETLEKALEKICKHSIRVTGCGRTDAGVHAKSYCANFKTECAIPMDRLPLALNALLPYDMAVQGAVEAPEDFNAILSCIKKEYSYHIHNSRIRDPFLTDRACFFPSPLDYERMAQAAREKAHAKNFDQDVARKRRIAERRRKAVEAQIAAFEVELAADESEFDLSENENQQRLDQLTADRIAMGKSRRSDLTNQ